MKRIILCRLIFILCIGFAFTVETNAQTQTNINGPAGSGQFGNEVFILPNGNFIVTDPLYDIPGGAADVGAVYLYSPAGNLISRVTGSSANDRVGGIDGFQGSTSGIKLLTNGNFVIFTPQWDNGSVEDAGAVTFVSGTNGLSGVVSAANSLVGSAQFDVVGSNVFPLTNGNYVVSSRSWDNGAIVNAGAATFGSGTTGVSGVVSTANSLVGSSMNDLVGSGITTLTNGNYVVNSSGWDYGAIADVGAATFGNGTTGISGTISAANSLVGQTAGNEVGEKAIALTNGSYVVISPRWDNGAVTDAGAATFGNGTTGITGIVSPSNSLVGSSANDLVGVNTAGAIALTNGNYVVISPLWDNAGVSNVGAATFANGTTGITGTITPANSLIGSKSGDQIGGSNSSKGLMNGNYVLVNNNWDNGSIVDAGSVTFGNGTTGTTGIVSPSNSLVGSSAFDLNSAVTITALTNGNYVVGSASWKNGSAARAGASTFGNGTTGVSGPISAANSLVGTQADDFVGNRAIALTNGNYVILSSGWDNGTVTNAGAATFANGTTGIMGTISATNSLVGSTTNDSVGFGATALTNGNYVVGSLWDNGAVQNVGAVTFGNGTTGITGIISPSNSLVGSTANDSVGIKINQGVGSFSTYVVKALSNGDYIVPSPSFDNGGIIDAGAITYGNGSDGTVGTINSSNSFLGTTANAKVGDSYDYNVATGAFVIGRPFENIVTIFNRNGTTAVRPTSFDFDGDGRADISVFRPDLNDDNNNFWHVFRSSDNQTKNFEWGIAADADSLAPADFDGDGKTDYAIWRETEQNFYIYNSSDNSVRVENFGLAGDKLTVGDWDGDGKDDVSVYRDGAQSYFYYRASSNNPNSNITFLPWGTTGDIPMHGDFDGDGKQDAAVFRPSNATWYIRNSSDGSARYVNFGLATDKFVPADYDGDGKTDITIYRSGIWYILQSSNNQIRYEYFGLSTDTLVPADYDGDGKTDVAVFRNGVWYLNRSTSGFAAFQFGLSGDTPIPNAYIAP